MRRNSPEVALRFVGLREKIVANSLLFVDCFDNSLRICSSAMRACTTARQEIRLARIECIFY